VLRVLETLGLVPSLIAGVSIGAVNAVVWVAHGLRSEELEAAWRRMRASHLGMRWITLALRWIGAAVFVVAASEVLVTLTGSRELSGSYWLWKRSSAQLDLGSTLLDAAAWALTAAAALVSIVLSRPIEELLARAATPADSDLWHRRFGFVVAALGVLHLLVWVFGWPWPHRFSATIVIALAIVWFANRSGRGGRWARRVLHALMPETKGRGLWGSGARRRVIEQLVGPKGRRRLGHEGPRLVVSALALDTGRVCHFVSGPEPSPGFRARLERDAGEVRRARDAEDLMRAALASSAIPGVFEPVRIGGRSFVDAGGFSNQPIHVAIADGADAVIVVLMSPSDSPPPAREPRNLLELGGRLLELANWRDLQAEMRQLPAEWSDERSAARLCLVEPTDVPGSNVLDFSPSHADELIETGERDAWRALQRAGWLESASGPEGAVAPSLE
jgi:predicted acylesterase/phospholipase RssA